MKVDIWMPIYVSDFLVDTQDLDSTEIGVYFRLLCYYWKQDGKLPDDGERLRRLTMLEREETHILDYILSRYFYIEEGFYRNKRADEELENARSRSDAARENVNKRWKKEKTAKKYHGNTTVVPPYNDGNTIDDTESIRNGYSSPSPSPIPKNKNKNSIPLQTETENTPTAEAPAAPLLESRDLEPSKKKALSPMKDELSNFYQDQLINVFPHEAWKDYRQERTQLNNLAKKTRNLIDQVPYADEQEFGKAILSEYAKMKKSKRSEYWRDAPFTPSAIVTRWDQIIDHLARGSPKQISETRIEDLAEMF